MVLLRNSCSSKWEYGMVSFGFLFCVQKFLSSTWKYWGWASLTERIPRIWVGGNLKKGKRHKKEDEEERGSRDCWLFVAAGFFLTADENHLCVEIHLDFEPFFCGVGYFCQFNSLWRFLWRWKQSFMKMNSFNLISGFVAKYHYSAIGLFWGHLCTLIPPLAFPLF